jgi:hypothetical protein
VDTAFMLELNAVELKLIMKIGPLLNAASTFYDLVRAVPQ